MWHDPLHYVALPVAPRFRLHAKATKVLRILRSLRFDPTLSYQTLAMFRWLEARHGHSGAVPLLRKALCLDDTWAPMEQTDHVGRS